MKLPGIDLSTVLRLLFTGLIFSFVSCQTKGKPKSAYSFLKTVSEDVNRRSPIQVDSITKLENMTALPPATLRFNYTLKYDTIKYDIRAFEKSIRLTTSNMIKTNPDSKMFKDMYATLEYNYSDTLGNFLFRLVFKPGEY